jgi:DNA-binding transcriptional ArsR family regulator
VTEINEIRSLGDAIGNEKRIFILKQLTENKKLTWSQISESLEKEFNIRMNPNTVSFHLKYLIDKGMVNKVGDFYILVNDKKNKIEELMK